MQLAPQKPPRRRPQKLRLLSDRRFLGVAICAQ
jgi:hypothetical protein